MAREEITSEWCVKTKHEVKDLKEDIDAFLFKHKKLLEKFEANKTVNLMGEEISGVSPGIVHLMSDIYSYQEKSKEILNYLLQQLQVAEDMLNEEYQNRINNMTLPLI